MRWARQVARMGEKRGVRRVLVRKPERKRHLENPRRRWEDSIKTDLREIRLGVWTGLMWLTATVAGCCKYGNEPSGSVEGGEFIEQLRYHWLLKKDTAKS